MLTMTYNGGSRTGKYLGLSIITPRIHVNLPSLDN